MQKMQRLTFISPVIAFGSVLAAVLGPTRLENVSELAALTPFGWLVVALAVLSLAVTLIKTHQQNVETQLERRLYKPRSLSSLIMRFHSAFAVADRNTGGVVPPTLN